MQRSPLYTILFATAVCIVCAIVVSSAAVSLKERQDINAALDKQRNVLQAAGLDANPKRSSTPQRVAKRFENIEMEVIDLATGEPAPDIDPATFNQAREAKDPATSIAAPPNPSLDQAGTQSRPGLQSPRRRRQTSILWSCPSKATVCGSSSTDSSPSKTISTRSAASPSTNMARRRGWAAKSTTRDGRPAGSDARIFGDDGEPKIEVIKGFAPPPAEAPYEVDGLSGATITSRGVTNLVHFWLGENGFGPYLENLEQRKAG